MPTNELLLVFKVIFLMSFTVKARPSVNDIEVVLDLVYRKYELFALIGGQLDVIIQLTLTIGGAILSAAGLAYLGMSPNVAKPEWGAMLNDGKPYLRTHPYLTTIPGVAISITVLAINWIGDGLRDAFDPKMRK